MSFLSSLSTLEATLKTDLLAAIGKPLLSSLASVQANPTVPNVMAQKVVLAGALIGALPTLESQGIAAVAAWLTTELQPAVGSGSTTSAS